MDGQKLDWALWITLNVIIWPVLPSSMFFFCCYIASTVKTSFFPRNFVLFRSVPNLGMGSSEIHGIPRKEHALNGAEEKHTCGMTGPVYSGLSEPVHGLQLIKAGDPVVSLQQR
jgi:hypothetical protein